MKKYQGKFLQFSTFNKKLSISGLLLDYNDDVSLLRHVPGDYALDGFILVVNKHIREFNIGESEIFTLKVIKTKLKHGLKVVAPKITIGTFDDTVRSISKKYGIFQINPMDTTICYLGSLADIGERTITINFLTPQAKWGGAMTFKKTEIRSIEFATDYIESLKLLASGKKNSLR